MSSWWAFRVRPRPRRACISPRAASRQRTYRWCRACRCRTEVTKAKSPLVLGLTLQPKVLAQVRSSRLKRLSEDRTTSYDETESVSREVLEARRLCARHGWRVIDVTNRPIENTAAFILKLLQQRTKDKGHPQEPDRAE